MFKKIWDAFTSGVKKVARFVWADSSFVLDAGKLLGVGALVAVGGGVLAALAVGAGALIFSFTIIGIVTFAILGWWKAAAILAVSRLIFFGAGKALSFLFREHKTLKGVTVNA